MTFQTASEIVGDKVAPTCYEPEKHQIAIELSLLLNCVVEHKLPVLCSKSLGQEYAVSNIVQPSPKTQFQPYSATKRAWACSETPIFAAHAALPVARKPHTKRLWCMSVEIIQNHTVFFNEVKQMLEQF